MTAYLPPEDILLIRDAAVETGLADPTVRPLLLDGILPRYRGTLPMLPAPGRQVHSDLQEMNRVERLVDGSVPLETWLRNAVAQTTEATALALFQRALDEVARSAGGEPDIAARLPAAETKEEIVHRDDTVPFGFLRGGDLAGAAVARLKVPPYRDGAPLRPNGFPHAGTGWLVAPGLLVTNHHVVNARSATGGERPHADAADLELQARHTRVLFDFEDDDPDTLDALGEAAGTEGAVAALAAADAELDYAVLRLAEAPGRSALRLAARPMTVADGEIVAVNIIQHPGGRAKRVGLRNNLVYAADEQDVRYFTDTRGGSSGSPVLTDDWKVVALHRGTRRVEDVRFQGRSTAFVNVGTQISRVMGHLAATSPALHEEIAAAQHDRTVPAD
ncbi:trypsin-like peptidase domain-containing protein [Streptomyces yaizuensis]|uniref:Serine protease n=1 Tax=Streptomyces yaizuensis TaxID=2989713 RepID=A0ABQ5NSM5_9ACTN|nr:trypsin-like peptidase domain-containing protein [Streptomyces sp. YSPA8]GLF93143.1 serine protease [Streptomyces sp. YSPA8]